MYRWEVLFSREALLIIITVSLSLPSIATFIHAFISSYPDPFPYFASSPSSLKHAPNITLLLLVLYKEKLSSSLHLNNFILNELEINELV